MCKLAARAILLLLLAGCVSAPPEPPSDSPETVAAPPETTSAEIQAENEQAVAEQTPTLPPPEEEIVYGSFPEDILARVIIAELAGQRGLNQTALDEYVALARETGDLGIIRRAGRIATFMRDTRAALDLNTMWLEQEPDSQEALQNQAFLLISFNRLREALAVFAHMQELGYNVDFRLISNRTENNAVIQPQLEALTADFETLLQQYPDDITLRLALAQIYQESNQLEQAYTLLNQLAVEMNDPVEILLAEVGILEAMGDTRRARRRLEDSIEAHPEDKQLRFAYARKLVEDGDYRDAMEQFEIIVDQDPQDFDMLYSLALISVEANQLNAARSYFERLLINGQRSNDVHYYLALISDEQNDPEQAIQHYLQVEGGNNYLVALSNYMELMIAQDRYREASEHLRQIRFRRPELNGTLQALEGSLLLDAGEYDLALTFLGRAINNNPNDAQLLQLRSIVAQEVNDPDLMESDLRQIMRLNPDNPSPFNTLGYYLADSTERYDEAFELISHAIELSPNDPAIIDSLGWVQYKLGRFEEARTNLELAFELYPDHEVAAHLGEVLWVMGNREEARAIWQNALETQPDSEYILNAMERLSADSSS